MCLTATDGSLSEVNLQPSLSDRLLNPWVNRLQLPELQANINAHPSNFTAQFLDSSQENMWCTSFKPNSAPPHERDAQLSVFIDNMKQEKAKLQVEESAFPQRAGLFCWSRSWGFKGKSNRTNSMRTDASVIRTWAKMSRAVAKSYNEAKTKNRWSMLKQISSRTLF